MAGKRRRGGGGVSLERERREHTAASRSRFATSAATIPVKHHGQARKGETVNSLRGGTTDDRSATIPSDKHIPGGPNAAGANRIADRERDWRQPRSHVSGADYE
jgi:hypothetical protein